MLNCIYVFIWLMRCYSLTGWNTMYILYILCTKTSHNRLLDASFYGRIYHKYEYSQNINRLLDQKVVYGWSCLLLISLHKRKLWNTIHCVCQTVVSTFDDDSFKDVMFEAFCNYHKHVALNLYSLHTVWRNTSFYMRSFHDRLWDIDRSIEWVYRMATRMLL